MKNAIKKLFKMVPMIIILVSLGGCIVLSDIGESFSCVPYGGMYTTSYWTEPYEKDGVQYLDRYSARFPIGFWGDLNVKFWNAYGDYRNTKTFKRFLEWQKLPDKEKGKVVGRYKKVGNEWVEIPLE